MPATGAWGHGGCMMKFRENEDAVSPVIGVILMVAITVILAAVIAAFVFEMTGSIETPKNVALTAKQISGNQLQVTVQGGTDLSTLKYLRINVMPSTSSTKEYYAYVKFSDNKTYITTSKPGDGTFGTIIVGSIFTSSNATTPNILTVGSDQVTITGHFMDGSEYMLLNTFL